MSRGGPSREIPRDPRIPQSYSSNNNNNTSNPIERQTSMSVGYLTRNPHSRDHPTYDLANQQNYIYTQPLVQQQNNMQSQPQHPQREPYERTGPIAATSVSGTSSSSSSQQTARITLPPLSAITENQENQSEGTTGQNAQTAPPSASQVYNPQHQQQSSSSQPQPSQHPTSQTPQQSSSQQPSPYSSRAPSQYEPQQSAYPHPQRHLQPSPQLAPDQPRYSSGPVMSSQVPLQAHQMPVTSLQQTQQMGQFSSSSPSPSHFQYNYQQPQYPHPQSIYGGYTPHQMASQMPPGIPYQPAYATSHRQRPPQFSPYPPPPSGFPPPPPQTATQGWPQQDYIAQPLTPLPGHSQQQPYSPSIQQIPGGPGGPGGPMRVRRPSIGMSGQPPYPPPAGGEQQQAPGQSQPQLKPKRKRATSHQLKTLNDVFASTFFPSTELRIALGKQLNMSPRTVQIWFQNKRQSWRANRTKQSGVNQTQGQSGAPAAQSGSYPGAGQYEPHPAKQEEHFGPSEHSRLPSSAEESREEGMENDEDGGWRALRQAQQDNPDNREYRTGGAGEDVGFDDDGLNNPHSRHR